MVSFRSKVLRAYGTILGYLESFGCLKGKQRKLV